MSTISLFTQMATYYSDSYYNTDTPSMTDSDVAVSAGVIVFAIMFALVIVVITYIIMAILLSRIFKKAGVESWKAWVPVYNSWILLELGDQKGYWAILAFIPVVSIVAAVFMYIAMYNIGLKLGKEGAFVLLAIFLPLVWFIWLAVDSSTWKGAKLAIAAASPADSAAPKK